MNKHHRTSVPVIFERALAALGPLVASPGTASPEAPSSGTAPPQPATSQPASAESTATQPASAESAATCPASTRTASTRPASTGSAPGGAPASSIAVAFSGGLDSSVLLHLAAAYGRQHSVPVFAFHVHHGISPNADAWLAHCEAQAGVAGVRFDARRVTVGKSSSGVEAAARKLRYAALGDLCAAHGVRLLLTAHHLDDQAETVLLQLLRGSGTAGLSGMDAANSAPHLLGNAELVMARPLLPLARADLDTYAAEHGIAWIDDESNRDTRYARNLLRSQVMPLLATAFPGFQERFARSAAHAQSAQRLLVELAAQDLQNSLDGDCILVASLRAMSSERASNMLRYWFSQRGLRMPSTSWLHEMLTQLVEARHDAQLLVTHPDCHIRRHRDRLHITPKRDALAGQRDPDDEGILVKEGQTFRWTGEVSIEFPDYGGILHIDEAAEGLAEDWLREQLLTIDFRKGGERLKPAPNRSTRPLKAHYQANDVPAWERERLPVVSTGKHLLFAAGIGMDCRQFDGGAGRKLVFRWETAAGL